MIFSILKDITFPITHLLKHEIRNTSCTLEGNDMFYAIASRSSKLGKELNLETR